MFVGVFKVVEKVLKGLVILVMLSDTFERYMSTLFYDSIEVDMNEEEFEIVKLMLFF